MNYKLWLVYRWYNRIMKENLTFDPITWIQPSTKSDFNLKEAWKKLG